MMRLATLLAAAPLALLAACSSEPDESEADAGMDPAAEQALNDDLMTDSDLAGTNEGNAALSGSGDRSLPDINRTPQAIRAARTRAEEMVGGADAMRPVQAPKVLAENDPKTPAMRRVQELSARRGTVNCLEAVEYTTSWAARLPSTFPVYPRGNTLEAAGTDEGGCGLRVVTFLTPVPLREVLAFYNTRALADGYSVEHVTDSDGDSVLSGTKGNAAFSIYGRTVQGVTEIDLVTSTP